MNKKILLVDCGSDYISDLEKSLISLDCFVKKVSIHDLSEKDFDVHGIVISGSPTLLTEVDTKLFLEKMKLIAEQKLPLLGICFGHQILGMHYGSNISIGEKRIDKVSIEWNDEHDLFEGLKSGNAEFGQWHREEIDLPVGFICLASSSQTDVEAIKHKELPYFGTQFHPEISGENGLRLLKNFLKYVE